MKNKWFYKRSDLKRMLEKDIAYYQDAMDANEHFNSELNSVSYQINNAYYACQVSTMKRILDLVVAESKEQGKSARV